MKSGISWSVRGIDDDTREAALEAARQSGLSLGEWLNQTIADRAAEQGVAPETREFDETPKESGADEAAAVADAVAKLTRRIRAMDETSRSAISGLKGRLDQIEQNLGRLPETQSHAGERSRSLKGVTAMVDALAREIDNADERARSMVEGLRERSRAAAPSAPEADFLRVSEAIRDLDARIASMSARVKAPPVEERALKLDELRDRLDALLARGPQPSREPPRAAALDQTLKSLEARIDEAKARLAVAPRQVPPPARAAATPPPAVEGDQLRRIEARLADITGRLGDADRNGMKQPQTPPKRTDDLTTAIAEISARQRMLDERADTLALRREQKTLAEMVAALRADIAGLGDKVVEIGKNDAAGQEAYFGLARRIEALAAEKPHDRSLLSSIRNELETLRAALDGGAREATLGNLEAGYGRVAEQLDDLIGRASDNSRLDALGQEISAVRRALEAADGPRAITRLEMRVNEVARSVEAALNSRQAAVDTSVSSLGANLETIRKAIDDLGAASRRTGNEAVARVETRFDEIAARIDGLMDQTPAAGAFADLQDRFSSLSERLEGMTALQRAPVAAIAGLDDRLATLSERLEGMSALQHEPVAAIAGLDDRLATLSERLEGMSALQREPVDAIAGLDDRLATLSDQLEGMAVLQAEPVAAIANLHERLSLLADRLDTMSAVQRQPAAVLDEIKSEIAGIRRDIAEREPPRIDNLESQIRELAARLEEAMRSGPEGPELAELEAQIARLADDLDRAIPRTGALKQVEENLAQLQIHLSDNRQESIDAARLAAREAVRDLADRVGADRIDANLIRALKEDLETLRHAASHADQRASETIGSVHETLAKVVERLTRLESEAERTSVEMETDSAHATSIQASEPTIPRATAAARILTRRAAEAADDNRPLEPGSAKPDLAALRELAASTADPQRKATDRRADFIAAARRAAQAAAAEAAGAGLRPMAATPAAPGEPSTGAPSQEPRQSAFARIGQAIRSRRRPLLLAAAAIVLAIGALQYFGRGAGNSGATLEDGALIAAEPNASLATPTHRDMIAETGAMPTVPQVRQPALITPSVQTDLAFAAPGPVDNHFGDVPAAPTASAFAPLDSDASDAPLAASADAPPPPATPALLAATAPDAAIGSPKLVSAAAAGDTAAAFEVAARYAEGRGVPSDLAKAAEWYRRAAEGGVAVAQYRLGSLYERGQGVKKDLNAAVDWYQRAADQGNIGAMHNLAVLMSEGVDGTPDHAKALQWFLAAADYGVKDSEYNLGVVYARGIGAGQDLLESYKWFSAAAAQGDTDAGTRRDEVAQMLSPDQLVQARATFQAWHAKSPLPEANGVTAPVGGWDTVAGITEADRSALVKKIQTLLAQQGYDAGPADGVEGRRTRDAVKAFQRNVGVAETGKIDTSLVAALADR
jgi:localization factor PodJL